MLLTVQPYTKGSKFKELYHRSLRCLLFFFGNCSKLYKIGRIARKIKFSSNVSNRRGFFITAHMRMQVSCQKSLLHFFLVYLHSFLNSALYCAIGMQLKEREIWGFASCGVRITRSSSKA